VVEWFFGFGDLVALLLGVLGAIVVLRGRRRRTLGAVVLAGLWLLSPGLYVVAMVALALGGGLWVLSRLLKGPKLAAALAALFVVGGIAAIVALAMTFAVAGRSMSAPSSSTADWSAQSDEISRRTTAEAPAAMDGGDSRGNRMAQLAQGGLIEGFTPEALPLPQYHRSAYAGRELVTEQRPFSPALYYVTDWVLWPLVAVWLLCLGLLGASYRRELVALYARMRERLTRVDPPAPAPAAAVPEAASSVEGPPES